MHIVAIRTSLAERYPWLPASVYKALLDSKAIGLEKLTNLAQLAVALPWMEVEVVETRALMGNDYWRYGVKDCRHEIDVMTRYAHEQGLTARELDRRGTVCRLDLQHGEDLNRIPGLAAGSETSNSSSKLLNCQSSARAVEIAATKIDSVKRLPNVEEPKWQR